MLDIGVSHETPILEIWNKIDRLSQDDLERISNTAPRQTDTYLLSSITGYGIKALREAIEIKLNENNFEDSITLTHRDGKKRAWLYSQGVVREEKSTDFGFYFSLYWSFRQKAQFQSIET